MGKPKPADSRIRLFIALFLVVLTLTVFWRVLDNGFIDYYDDEVYVTENARVRAGLTASGIVWALTSTYASNWHPLTWVSHTADVSLFGMRPAGHHATNLVLHILNTLLLFLVLLRLTGSPSDNPKSAFAGATADKSEVRNPIAPSPTPPLSPSSLWACAFVAALFAIHPLHVESVAWIAERKDVLSAFLFLLTILAYVRYVERPGIGAYAAVVVAFALGLMAKPMLVTLPFVLLLLDFWPLGRQSAVSPDLPSPPPSPVAASRTGEGAGSGSRVAASRTSGEARSSFRTPETRNPKPGTHHRPPATDHRLAGRSKIEIKIVLEKIPLLVLSVASCCLTYYAQHAGGAVAGAEEAYPFGMRLANAIVAYVEYIRKMVWPSDLIVFYPHPGPSLPVWQVVGAALLLAAVSALVLRSRRTRPYLLTGWFWFLGTLVPVIGLVQVGGQAMADRYTYVPLVGLFVMIAWGTLDLVNGRKGERGKGRREDAETRGRGDTGMNGGEGERGKGRVTSDQLPVTSERVCPIRTPETRNPKPVTKERTPNTQHLTPTLAPSPSLPLALVVLAILSALTWRQVGYWHDNISLFERAVQVRAGNYIAENNLGAALARENRLQEAVPHFEESVRANPRYADAQYNLGVAYAKLMRNDEAIAAYEAAIRSEPDHVEAHANLAVALYYKRDYAGAWREVERAQELGFEFPPALIQALSRQPTGP